MAAAAVVVDHEAVMGTALERIGLDTPGAWEEFVESTGFETLSDLLDMSDEDIKDSCYSYNKDEDTFPRGGSWSSHQPWWPLCPMARRPYTMIK